MNKNFFYLIIFYMVFLFSVLLHFTALASTILIRSPNTDLTEFEAYAETESVTTYAQYLINLNKKTPRPIKISYLLKKAQEAFLSYSPNKSKKYFLQITKHLHSFDWNKKERQIIFYSLLRLAQLEKNPQKQKLLLQEALVFEVKLKLDLQVFPPSLIKIYLNLKKKSVFVSIDLKKIYPLHEIFIINGYLLNTNIISLPYGRYRVTALSSSHKKHMQVVSLSRLMSQKIKTNSLINGSCQQPNLNSIDTNLKKNKLRILFSNFCIWNSIHNQIIKNPINNIQSNITMMQNLKLLQKKSQPWWKQEWFWIGTILTIGTTSIMMLKHINKTQNKTQNKIKNITTNKFNNKNKKPAKIITIGF